MNSNAFRRLSVIALMAVGLTLLIWAGVHNGRERRLQAQQVQDAQANKADLIPAGSADSSGDTQLQGKQAPDFSLVDLDGKKVALSEFKGKPILLTFWATWCGPCKLEMPWIQEFSRKYEPQGLVTLGIATDDVPKSVVEGVIGKAGVTYPTLLADNKVDEAYGGVNYVPESFYIDRTGKVLIETAGLTEDGKDEIEANIKKLIAAGGR